MLSISIYSRWRSGWVSWSHPLSHGKCRVWNVFRQEFHSLTLISVVAAEVTTAWHSDMRTVKFINLPLPSNYKQLKGKQLIMCLCRLWIMLFDWNLSVASHLLLPVSCLLLAANLPGVQGGMVLPGVRQWVTVEWPWYLAALLWLSKLTGLCSAVLLRLDLLSETEWELQWEEAWGGEGGGLPCLSFPPAVLLFSVC